MASRPNGHQPGEKRRTPVMATDATGAIHPYLEVLPPYYLAFDPERWTVIAGSLVPALQHIPLVTGVNRVEVQPKTGAVRFAACRARLEEEGRTLIPWAWAPDGESYLQCIDTRPNGSKEVQETWISVFESVDVAGRETTPDEEAYAAWLTSLVDSGKLPPCSANVAKKMLSSASERLEKAKAEAAKLSGHGGASIRARALQAEVDALSAYLAKLKSNRVVAKPKTRALPAVDEVSDG